MRRFLPYAAVAAAVLAISTVLTHGAAAQQGQGGFGGQGGGFGGPGGGFGGQGGGFPGQPGFPGGPGGPMMMGGGPSSVAANATQVFVVQGGTLYAFDAKTLKVTAQANLPQPQGQQGRQGQGRPGGFGGGFGGGGGGLVPPPGQDQ